MNEIISAVLTAGATLIAAWIMYSRKLDKIVDQIEQLKQINGLVEKEHQGRSSEHNGLSLEHKELSSEHKELSEQHNKLKEDLKNELGKIYLNQEREKAVREAASQKLPDESGLVSMAKAVLDNNMRLQQENATIRTQMKQLQKENQQLKIQIMNLKTYREQSVELDEMDLFDDMER